MPSEFEVKEKQRRVMRRNIARAKDYFTEWSKKTDEECIQKCETLIHDIRRMKTEYEHLVYETLSILDCESADEEKKKEDELYKELEDVTFGVISLHGKIIAYLKGAGARNPRESIATFESTTNSTVSSVPDIRLPKIQIPKFNGDPRRFLKFKSLFSNLIHEDTSIPNIRKLYYLQEALEGATEEFIRDVDMTETSYNSVWAELLNRYENKRVIIRAHLADLFGIKRIKDESGIRTLLDSATASLHGLKGCGENPDQWSTILSYLLSTKLDDATKRDFENSIENKKSYPSFKELSHFLETRASAVEERKGISTSDKPKNQSVVTQPSKASSGSESKKKSYATSASFPKCVTCGNQHILIECKQFESKSPQERYDVIQKNQLCTNCFGRNHRAAECKKGSCKTCHQKHHTLLHFNRPSSFQPKEPVAKPADPEKPKSTENVKTCSAVAVGGPVLLPTAVVQFCCKSRTGFARLLTDAASEVTLITEAFVRKHRLSTQKSPYAAVIEGIGDSPVHCCKMCGLTLRSRISSFEMLIDCFVVPTSAIKYQVSLETICTVSLKMPDVELAEAELLYNFTDILVGAEYVESYLLNETINVERVTLRNSRFGWLALGNASDLNPSAAGKPCLCHTTTLHSIERQLQNLYESETFDAEPSISEEQQRCVDHFEATYQRGPEGEFIVNLPLKGDVKELADTRRFAEKSVSRILSQPVEVTQEYHEFIQEYESLNHLKFVDYSSVSLSQDYNSYYLPQLMVVRLDKSTTRFQVVFHVSFKCKAGKSLNDILTVGPTIQLDLFDIILRFRRHTVAFTADIEKMYRQILVAEADRSLQKIFYRESMDAKLKVGVLNTLTYGTSPASFIATKCLHVLASEVV